MKNAELQEEVAMEGDIFTPKGVYLLTMGTINDLLILFKLKP
jgi:hypothetical protein